MYLNVLETMGMGVGGAAIGKACGEHVPCPEFECVVKIADTEPRTEGWPCCDDRSFWGDLCHGNLCYGDAELLC